MIKHNTLQQNINTQLKKMDKIDEAISDLQLRTSQQDIKDGLADLRHQMHDCARFALTHMLK